MKEKMYQRLAYNIADTKTLFSFYVHGSLGTSFTILFLPSKRIKIHLHMKKK